jgi:hypothetical protein
MLTYKGAHRLVEPRCHGFGADGHEVLVVYQRAGESASGQGEGWKALAVEEIDGIETVDVTFLPDRPGYRPGLSKNIVDVHCYV